MPKHEFLPKFADTPCGSVISSLDATDMNGTLFFVNNSLQKLVFLGILQDMG